ncbi:MAG: HAD-IA family hydrolase [Nanoarchaeota archaeon]
MAEKLKFKGHWSELAKANQKNLKPNQLLLDYIQTIKGKVCIALFSNLDKTSIQAIKNKLNLQDYFEKVYFSYEHKIGKLEKQLIDKVLADFKLKTEEVLFIDDFQGNLEKAEKYGMKTLLYTDVKTVKKELNTLLKCD